MEQRAPRYPFDAPAEVIIESSGARIPARVNELSLHGCYLDTSTPLTGHTAVLVKIFGPSEYFEAHSTVIYAHPLLGMGVAFRNVNLACQAVLHKWLLAAMQAKEKSD
jgi:PilZ domain